MIRKDMIWIAVVINAGLLAVLFTTAMIYDTDKLLEQPELDPLVEVPQNSPQTSLIATGPLATVDEVDHVLRYYAQPAPMKGESQTETYLAESLLVPDQVSEEEFLQEASPPLADGVVEVIVKKGDVLEKIARANGTTVSAIKKANNLQSERLFIGQVLKIPLKKEKQAADAQTKPQTQKKETASTEAVYYVVKNGDNPWKIAKQFNVKFEDILRLNQLDEERARNMKVGDRIRVK